MYLTRLKINRSRIALNWIGNPYRVHQRLCMACESDPRLLFRIEDKDGQTQILAQSQQVSHWGAAFDSFPVLAAAPEMKEVHLTIQAGQRCRFRLLANPTVKRDGRRLGLLKEEDQRAWLERKLTEAGAGLVGCWVVDRRLQKSEQNPAKEVAAQVHLAVLFEGALQVIDPDRLAAAVAAGIGAAKGYGFGLLSLARIE